MQSLLKMTAKGILNRFNCFCMNKVKVLFLVLACSFGTGISLAQSPKEPIDKFRVITKHTGNNHLSNPKKQVEPNDTMFVTLSFRVIDWSKASKIYLKLGDKADVIKKANLTIDPGKPNYGLPKGISYSIQKSTMYITLGAQRDMNTYLASIVAEDKQGKKSKELKVEKE